MLIIRDEQIKMFEKMAVRNFENIMIEYLGDFAPGHAESLGKDGLRRVILLGMNKAEQYGFDTGGPVRFFLEMMFMFGSYFDMDCQIPWANKILTDPVYRDQAERADAMYDAAMDYLDKTAGPDREFAAASLKRAAEQSFEDLQTVNSDLVSTMITRLKVNSPEKCRHIGDKTLHTLIHKAQKEAEAYDLGGQTGTIVFTGFMFMSGQGFANDPLYPWVNETLTDETIKNPKLKLKRLHSKGIAYATGALKNLEAIGR